VTAPIKPQMRDDLTVVELDGETVVYDEQSGDLHHLNPTATVVATLCDGTVTIRELATEISAAFEVPQSEVERQVRRLLGRLRRTGLLRDGAGTGRG
jgi:PqqD family protein of HPr-rel-A system